MWSEKALQLECNSQNQSRKTLCLNTWNDPQNILERRSGLVESTNSVNLTQETDVHIPFLIHRQGWILLTISSIIFETVMFCLSFWETFLSCPSGDQFCPLVQRTCWHISLVCETLSESGEAFVLEGLQLFSFCWNQQVQTVSYNQLAQSWTSGLHWTGMRNARSEPMPLPGLTESFYTPSSLLSQFYPLFHSILIGHSSLEHLCTLEALSVIPYHPQLCLSLTAPPSFCFSFSYCTTLTLPFHLSVVCRICPSLSPVIELELYVESK